MNAFLRRWKDYFEVNAALPDGIPWGSAARLSAVERAWIGPSLAAFQLGESSDGRGLLAAAAACGLRPGWSRLEAVTQAFIREEQGHAALLGRFLDWERLPRIGKEWTDRVFRFLRRHMDLESILAVLLTAEILSLVYYRALAASTANAVLRGLCRKVLVRKAHALLFGVTLRVVYLRHRQVLKRGGYPYVKFRRAAWAEFDRVMDPRAVLAPSIPEAGSWEERDGADVVLRWEPLQEAGRA